MSANVERLCWWAYKRVTPEQRHHLTALVGEVGYLEGGPLGVAPIVEAQDLFEFDKNGKPAAIMPVKTADGKPADLLAWRSRTPDHWWAFTGVIPILGAEKVEESDYFGLPLHMHKTPLSWLRAGCNGAVVLDWSRHLGFALVGADKLLCDDDALAQRLSDALKRDGVPAEVRIWRERHAQAA